METKVEKINENNIDYKVLNKAGEVLRQGGLVVFPTETVYGLGANALDEDAVRKIFIAKGRPQDNPLIIHVSDKRIEKYVDNIPKIAYELMDKFWPGPLTIIMEKSEIIPNVTSADLNTVGIRMPNNIIARELIKSAQVPVAAPSANTSGKPSPTVVERCIEDLSGKVDYILGGDKSEIGLESTVIDCTVYPPCILRPGAITLEMLQEMDKHIYIDPAILEKLDNDIKPKAPGMKYRHYAPKAKVRIIKGKQEAIVQKINSMAKEYVESGLKVGIMASEETKYQYSVKDIISLGSRGQMNNIGKNLFEALRKMDDLGVDVVLSEAFEEKGFGIAIMNRLKKSAGYDVINLDE